MLAQNEFLTSTDRAVIEASVLINPSTSNISSGYSISCKGILATPFGRTLQSQSNYHCIRVGVVSADCSQTSVAPIWHLFGYMQTLLVITSLDLSSLLMLAIPRARSVVVVSLGLVAMGATTSVHAFSEDPSRTHVGASDIAGFIAISGNNAYDTDNDVGGEIFEQRGQKG